MERMIAKAILQERGNIQAEISSQIQKAIDHHIPSQLIASVRIYKCCHIPSCLPTQTQTHLFRTTILTTNLSMTDFHIAATRHTIWLALQLKFENLSAKRQKTSEYEAYVSGESSFGQVNEEEQGPSTSVSQDIMEEVSLTIDEAKLKKMADEMLRQNEFRRRASTII
ncbi:hypothetical protein Tco_0733395 [Tanacetum coccineum]